MPADRARLLPATPAPVLSEAGIGRLHEATGRPALRAAAACEDAQELEKLGHGAFTTAPTDALHHGDSNGNGLVEISVRAFRTLASCWRSARALVLRGLSRKRKDAAYRSGARSGWIKVKTEQ
jgi:uncharacterized caspase-like protein